MNRSAQTEISLHCWAALLQKVETRPWSMIYLSARGSSGPYEFLDLQKDPQNILVIRRMKPSYLRARYGQIVLNRSHSYNTSNTSPKNLQYLKPLCLQIDHQVAQVGFNQHRHGFFLGGGFTGDRTTWGFAKTYMSA